MRKIATTPPEFIVSLLSDDQEIEKVPTSAQHLPRIAFPIPVISGSSTQVRKRVGILYKDSTTFKENQPGYLLFTPGDNLSHLK